MTRSQFAFATITFSAAFANLVPLLLVVPAGDTVMNYMMVDCFSTQIWSGILYPRWCMDANAGLGSPGPIFYFPLPYYITALFAPLRWLGASVETHYLVGVLAANTVAFLCCYAWLKSFVSRRTALFCAFLFLFGFYRAEMMTRASYAEYWCVAFLPLLMLYAARICESPRKYWLKLALVMTICMLCHAPATLIGLMAAGLYVLVTRARAVWVLAAAGAVATLVSLPHYLPMKTLRDTLNQKVGGYSHWQKSWVNSYADVLFDKPEQFWSIVGLGIGMVTLTFMMGALLYTRKAIPPHLQRLGLIWCAIGMIAFFMMFSVSAPLWLPVEIISGVRTPWRMQSLIVLAMIAIVALLSEYVWFRNPKTRVGDQAMLSLYFIFTTLFYAGGVASESIDIHKQIVRSQYSLVYFATKEMDGRYGNIENFYQDFVEGAPRPKAQWVRGGGRFDIKQWDAHGILVSGHANTPGTLRLWQFYYPLWQAELNDTPVDITAEGVSGRMLIAVPEGKFTLWLRIRWPDVKG